MSLRSSPAKKEKVVENTTDPNWLQLPIDMLVSIFQKLDTLTKMRALRVCSLWSKICKDPFVWRTLKMDLYFTFFLPENLQDFDSLEKMCRYAVDLSCGQLEDLSIHQFSTDDLLNYIADRANHLRHLKIDYSNRVSVEGICEIAKKLPLLETLHIRGSFCEVATLEGFGQSCPLLKSLTYEGDFRYPIQNDDDEAFAIAKTMPGLRYLNISRNQLSDVGLRAILDECPLLDSLNVHLCYNLHYSGDLWKRCQDQIKNLEDDENEAYY